MEQTSGWLHKVIKQEARTRNINNYKALRNTKLKANIELEHKYSLNPKEQIINRKIKLNTGLKTWDHINEFVIIGFYAHACF